MCPHPLITYAPSVYIQATVRKRNFEYLFSLPFRQCFPIASEEFGGRFHCQNLSSKARAELSSWQCVYVELQELWGISLHGCRSCGVSASMGAGAVGYQPPWVQELWGISRCSREDLGPVVSGRLVLALHGMLSFINFRFPLLVTLSALHFPLLT